MNALFRKIRTYYRRGRFFLNVRKIGSSVMEHKKEYAILARGVKNFLVQKGSKLQKGSLKWHR